MINRLPAFLLALLLLASVLVFFPLPVAYADGGCIASPSQGEVGTTFSLAAGGFTPNTPLFSYAVDPNGTAFSDPNFNAFGGNLKSSANGTVAVDFRTRFDVQEFTIARAYGTWQVVIQQLGQGNTVAYQVICSFTVTPNDEGAPQGANLVAMPNNAPVGSEIVFYGSGFPAGQIVNLWVSPPLGCTSFAYGYPHILLQYSTASAYAQDNVRADGAGQFAYKFPTDRTYTCPGDWAMSAYAPSSKVGAVAYLTLTPQGVFEPGQPVLVAASPSVAARGGSLALNGWYFMPNSVVSCWLGRPDMTLRFLANYQTNTAGAFAFVFETGWDDENFQLHYSEGTLGNYTISCRDNENGTEASTSFLLTGGTINSFSSTGGTSNLPALPLSGPMGEP